MHQNRPLVILRYFWIGRWDAICRFDIQPLNSISPLSARQYRYHLHQCDISVFVIIIEDQMTKTSVQLIGRMRPSAVTRSHAVKQRSFICGHKLISHAVSCDKF